MCLHCRHEARLAAQAKRKRLLLRGSAVSAAFLSVVVVGALGAMALRGRGKGATHTAQAAEVVAMKSATDTTAAPVSVKQEGDVQPRPAAPLAPVIAPGQTSFGDGITAERSDSLVTLYFDTPLTRTRIPEKFERFVRATLPKIYGAAADSALARLPVGEIAAQGNLLQELPSRGVHIPLERGWQIALFPETRPGEDGPLVIRYRVSVLAQQD
ncbi:MAG TPA: hypothetical protein VHB25_10225 [Gemmatimonadaceae bacterium]|nr:hypothetical protein [Gemmatimonadaceae bacterium]